VLVVLAAGAVWGFTRPLPASDPVTPDRVLRALDGRSPRILVVGNSSADRAFELTRVGAALGLEPDQLALTWVPSSGTPAWYALLRNHVLPRVEPEVVVVAGTLDVLVGSGVDGEGDAEALDALLVGDEAALTAKLQGAAAVDGPSARARTRRTALRQGLLDWFIHGAVGLATPGDGGPHDRGAEALALANAEVFADEDAIDMDRHRAGTPIVAPERRTVTQRRYTQGPLPVEHTLVPELVDVVRDAGAQVIFLRLPESPGGAQRGPGLRDEEDALKDHLRSRGAAYVDLSAADLSAGDFNDRVHLGHSGRRKIAPLIAQGLSDVGALSGGPLARPAASLRVRREGAAVGATLQVPASSDCTRVLRKPPFATIGQGAMLARGWPVEASPVQVTRIGGSALPARRLRRKDNACEPAAMVGERVLILTTASTEGLTIGVSVPDDPVVDAGDRALVWHLAGTRTVLDVPAGALAGDGTVSLELVVEVFGAGQVSLALGKHEVALETAGRHAVRFEGPATTGGSALVLSSPADGAHAAVASLRVAGQGITQDLLPPAFDVLGGTVPLLDASAVRFAQPPPALPASGDPSPAGQGVYALALPDDPAVPPLALTDHLTYRRCSPLTLTEGSTALERRVGPRPVAAGPGRFVHLADSVRFSPLAQGPPVAQRTWTLGLDPARVIKECRRDVWLYPGDRFTMAVRVRGNGSLMQSLSQLGVKLRGPPGDAGPSVQLTLEPLAGQVSSIEVAPDPARQSLPLVVSPDVRWRTLTVTVENPVGAPTRVLRQLDLEAPPPAADAWQTVRLGDFTEG